MMAETGTRIDWWVITRDTLFFIIYLIIITTFLSSNEITLTNAFILIAIYVVHIFAMKWNQLYEVAIKKNVARMMEIRELTRIAQTDIDFFHKNLNSRCLTIEMLMKLDYKVENMYIVFDQQYRKRIKDPKVVIEEEEKPMEMMDDPRYVCKLLWKKSAIKVIIRIQAYKFYEKVRRNKRSVVEITKMLPYLADDKDNSARAGDESMRYLEG
jgi:Ca2+/Na+ antiporter